MKPKYIVLGTVLAGLAWSGLLWSNVGAPGAENLSRFVFSRGGQPTVGHELPTSAPGVSYLLLANGDVEFHASPDFRGVAITPDGRNLYLAK